MAVIQRDNPSAAARIAAEREALDDPAFTLFRDALLDGIKPAAEIDLLPGDSLLPWQSCIGGRPYFPQGVAYPHDAAGRPLQLLAQIHFAEMPPLPDYPRSGLLQFFIGCSDLWGMNLDDLSQQDNFRVIYHPHIQTDLEKQQPLPSGVPFVQPPEPQGLWQRLRTLFVPSRYLPYRAAFALQFGYREQCISVGDFSLRLPDGTGGWVTQDAWFEDDGLSDRFCDAFSGEGLRVGGYPYFTQEDPRSGEKWADYELLLQIDSYQGRDGKWAVLWGDAGVGNFFIRREDLRRCDFSQVLFYWDCT